MRNPPSFYLHMILVDNVAKEARRTGDGMPVPYTRRVVFWLPILKIFGPDPRLDGSLNPAKAKILSPSDSGVCETCGVGGQRPTFYSTRSLCSGLPQLWHDHPESSLHVDVCPRGPSPLHLIMDHWLTTILC